MQDFVRDKRAGVICGLLALEDLDESGTRVLRDDDGLAWRVRADRRGRAVGGVANGRGRSCRRCRVASRSGEVALSRFRICADNYEVVVAGLSGQLSAAIYL